MINFSDHCFILLVHSRHHLFAQSTQLSYIHIQFSGQGFCLPFGACNKVFFLLDALLGSPDFSLEIL
jgi:hypothetical protein